MNNSSQTQQNENSNHLESFENILIAIDIGGTLVKLVVAVTKIIEKESFLMLVERDFEEIVLEENNLYIKKYHTSQFTTEVMDFLKVLKVKSKLQKINVTGGGAHKFNKILNVKTYLY